MSLENNTLDHLKSVKDRVFWIYSNSQDAIDSNGVLTNLYREYFNDFSESVTRAGRWWRSEKAGKDVFVRSEDLKERDAKLFDLNKGFWSDNNVKS